MQEKERKIIFASSTLKYLQQINTQFMYDNFSTASTIFQQLYDTRIKVNYEFFSRIKTTHNFQKNDQNFKNLIINCNFENQ